MAKTLRVGMIGYRFMGKAHSNAWRQVNHFFPDLPAKVEMHTLCGRTKDATAVLDALEMMDGDKIELSDYVARLEGVLKKEPNPRKRIVFIVAEDGSNYGALVHLFDGAKQAGADTLGLMTDDLDKK